MNNPIRSLHTRKGLDRCARLRPSQDDKGIIRIAELRHFCPLLALAYSKDHLASPHAERDAALLALGGAGFLFHGGFLSSRPPRGGRVSLGARGIPRRRRPGPGAVSRTGPRESGLLNGPRHDGSEAARSQMLWTIDGRRLPGAPWSFHAHGRPAARPTRRGTRSGRGHGAECPRLVSTRRWLPHWAAICSLVARHARLALNLVISFINSGVDELGFSIYNLRLRGKDD